MLASSTPNYGARQAAYDLKKLRGKPSDQSRQIPALRHPPEGIHTIGHSSFSVKQFYVPFSPESKKPPVLAKTEEYYETIRQDLLTLFGHVRIGVTLTNFVDVIS